MSVSSSILINQLFKQGVIPNKSRILKPPPHIPKDLIRHWVRGYFDGDGSFHISKQGYLCFSVLGTEEILSYILKGFNSKCNANLKIGWDRTIRQTGTCGNKAVLFLDWIYEECDYYLPRKYNKYLEFRAEKGLTEDRTWTDQEIESLKNFYPRETRNFIENHFRNRTWCGISTKAEKLGIKRNRGITRKD